MTGLTDDTVPETLATGDDPPWRERFRRRVRTADGIVVASDFDGTLANIREDPDAAAIRPDAREALAALADRADVRVAVVSGRELEDLRERVGLDGIAYAGNHGLELAVEDRVVRHPDAEAAADEVAACCGELRDRLGGIDGVLLEEKGLSATVHYRQADNGTVDRVRAAVRAVAGDRDAIEITGGRQILELRPAVEWNKGAALEWLLEEFDTDRGDALYVGDDETDEDAFRAIEPDGIGLLVGERPSAASYRLPDPAAVADLLAWLADR